MSNDNSSKEINDNNKLEEEIYFGKKVMVCFACGEIIYNIQEFCPYCGIKIE